MPDRFLLLQVLPHSKQIDSAVQTMAELTQLVNTYGGKVVKHITQYKNHPDLATYIGSGKLEELIQLVEQFKVDVVAINDLAKSSQLFRLEKALWPVNQQIKVWDRVDLILNIFDQHATSTEAKLQIELAKIQHIGPRIYGMGKTELSRQGGGIGTRGLGETNIERERRLIRKRTQQIKAELAQRTKVQQTRIKKRQLKGIATMALVGYTSAGKTTLFNALTSKRKTVHQGLFTTLDTVVGKIKLTQYAPTVLVSDTIGFIENLPPFLVEAFQTTLMESVAAKVLVHVVDAADTQVQKKIGVVEDILTELGVSQPPLLVFNKLDLLSSEQADALKQQYAGRQSVFVSALTQRGMLKFKQIISQKFLVNLP
ncbi:MAG: GTPase HflX [Candidatus Pacebacteria bacterium CG_4_10_14_0_8_um_filter_43_12]|nr:MAG: GTPase HflX [Candidatus Pacebacteria bacterium CG10_big_fil_rev_8_21_14_0_10_44_11]PIY78900.1 MAG: GTPase HflX [Candidatus Pacebacteria bacterium CG_4_10_14_0_8_um_filter_43_12]